MNYQAKIAVAISVITCNLDRRYNDTIRRKLQRLISPANHFRGGAYRVQEVNAKHIEAGQQAPIKCMSTNSTACYLARIHTSSLHVVTN